MEAQREQTELSDEKIIEIISSNGATFRDLVYIIYSKFDELDSILHLFKITNFKISHMQDFLPPTFYNEQYALIKETMYTYRASVISLGTKIIFDRHGVILSNLLTLIYFFVEYLRENELELTEETKFPGDENIEAYKYINNYMPLPEVILYDMNTPLNLFNTIDGHVVSGGRPVHFFISSASTLPTPGYLGRAIITAGPKYIPVIIKIKISSENPAVKSFLEDDHVIGSVLYGSHIETIRMIEKDETGEIMEGKEIVLKGLSFPHSGGSMIKKSKKKKSTKRNKTRNKKKTKRKYKKHKNTIRRRH